MKRVVLFILMVGCVAAAGQGLAGEEPGQAQVVAATKDAVNNLLAEVSRVSLTSRMSVGEFLRRTGSTEEMIKVLQRAQQMGGPRWLDEYTCQVELQISGPVVAQHLKRVAAAEARWSPIGVAELDRAVRNWDQRAFTATGTATSRVPIVIGGAPRGFLPPPRAGFVPDGNDRARPDAFRERDAARAADDAGREQAVAAAKADAGRRTLSAVRAIPLTRTATVGDVLDVRSVADGMRDWFAARKTTRVIPDPDGEATVELAATPGETFDALRALALKQKDVPVPPANDPAWDRARIDFERQMPTPLGRSGAPAAAGGGGVRAGARPEDIGNAVIGRKPPVVLPDRAPAWVDRRLSATGRGGHDKNKLRAARAAQDVAAEKLRREIDQLPLTPRQTIGQAAKDEPRIARAVTRALWRSQISDAKYLADGAADIDVYLDLDVLWQELQAIE